MVSIRFTPEDFEILSEQAEERGISVSQHARNIILKNMIKSPPSGDITKPEDVIKVCNFAIEELLKSEQFEARIQEIVHKSQKDMLKETLSELIKEE